MKPNLLPAILLTIVFMWGCGEDDLDPSEETPDEIVAALCDSAGTVKTGLVAEVYNLIDDEWMLRIADSVKVAEYVWLWQSTICNGVPDSLKEHGLELLIDYADKSKVINDTSLYMVGELLKVRRIGNYPEEDPRNAIGMATFYLKDANGNDLYIEKGMAFTSQNEWSQFLAMNPGVYPSRTVDFDTHTLLAQPVTHGGCGWLYKRQLVASDETSQVKFVVMANIYGQCQAMQRTYHWVTVPKINPGTQVLFEFVEEYHSQQSN